MKKTIKLLLVVLLSSLIFSACQIDESRDPIIEESKMIMLKDQIWYSTETEMPIELDENNIEGKIKSSVERTSKPKQNEESNFGELGSSYSFIDDQVLVYLDEEWILFVDEETWKSAEGDISVKGAIVIGYSESDENEIFGDLDDEEIRKITNRIMEEIKNKNKDESKDEIIEKVFRESGIEDSAQIEAAKSKISISEP